MVCVYGPVPALLNTTFLYEWHDQLLREDNPKAGARKNSYFCQVSNSFQSSYFQTFRTVLQILVSVTDRHFSKMHDFLKIGVFKKCKQ